MLRVIGAGLPRTATHTLKVVLPQLTGGPCYHMSAVAEDHVPVWQAALDGTSPDWPEFFAEYAAAVDFPASAFWPELADTFPDSVLVLSTRADSQTWWRSADATILERLRQTENRDAWWKMAADLWTSAVCPDWDDGPTNRAAYDRWNEHVRRAAPPGRLVEWQAADGWEPLCTALDVPIPDEPFPLTNSTVEWQERRRQRALE
jgi:sulfotransferase family protein